MADLRMWELKDGATLDGVHPYILLVVLPLIYAVTIVTLGRRPIVTSARRGTPGDPSTLHDDGFALDLRANDVGEELRELYARRLRLVLAPLGCEVVGPYPMPRGHVHVELDPRALLALASVGVIAVLIVSIRAVTH